MVLEGFGRVTSGVEWDSANISRQPAGVHELSIGSRTLFGEVVSFTNWFSVDRQAECLGRVVLDQ